MSTQVILRMDELHDIPRDLTSYLLNVKGTTEFKLDLRVMYLRRVHHFCFYAAKWCKDEWSLRDVSGAAILREPYKEGQGEAAWAVEHEKRIQQFLAAARLDRPHATFDDKEVTRRFEELCGEKTSMLSEQKFQCQECRKLFKGKEFVCKHILRTHPKIMEEVREEFHLKAAKSAFLADGKRPTNALLRVS